MFIKKDFNKILYLFISLFFFISFYINFDNYIGSKLLFFVFQLCSFFLFLRIIKKKIYAFEFFLFSFLFLSFWFKFSCILYFQNINVTEGDFDLSHSNYDSATTVIIVVFLACIISSLINEFYLSTENNTKKKFLINNNLLLNYKKYRFLFYLILFSFLGIIWFSNLYYEIYLKGLSNQKNFNFVYYFYSWGYTYGFSLIVSLFIYLDFCIFKEKKIFLIAIFESLFTSFSSLSRTFILNIIVYFRGFLYLLSFKNKLNIKKIFTFKIFFFILLIFFLSFYSTNKIRNKIHFGFETSNITYNLKNATNEFLSLLINRWVGIDGLLSVSQSNKLNFRFFLSSWSEKKNENQKSFYIDNFFKKFDPKFDSNKKKNNKNLNIVITPGFVAFLFYSGSLLFVFFLVIILIFFGILIEKIFYFVSYRNIILSNIVGYALAYRLIHFGYLPSNSVNFILSFALSLLFVGIINRILWKKY